MFAVLSAATLAQAQGIGSSFQEYQGNLDEPISIEADLLEVDDKSKQATFRGNVVASQGGFSLKAKELIVHYTGNPSGEVTQARADQQAETAGQQGQAGSIKRIEAKGKVIVATKDDQTATSEWADFDVEKQLVTIGGNVVLSQGENVLRGDRLVIDLKTGKSRFEVEGESGSQRIRGLFLPRQDNKDKPK
jgi:lipopolysaccharide export system protein LptA